MRSSAELVSHSVRFKLRVFHSGRGASWRGIKMLHITPSGSRILVPGSLQTDLSGRFPEWIYASPNKLGQLQTLAWSNCASYSSSPLEIPHIPLSTGQLLLFKLFLKKAMSSSLHRGYGPPLSTLTIKLCCTHHCREVGGTQRPEHALHKQISE